MTTSIREQVLAALKTQITNANTGLSVYRNRKEAITAPPALVIEDGGQDVDESNSAETRYRLRAVAFGYVAAAAGEDGEDVGGRISDAYAKVVAAVIATRSLGLSFVDDTREAGLDDPEFDDTKGTRDSAAFRINFIIEFVTAVGNPYSAP